MPGFHALVVLAGADSHECNAIPVLWIHIRLNFKYETGKFFFQRIYHPTQCLSWLRLWRVLDKIIQQLGNTKVVNGRAKKRILRTSNAALDTNRAIGHLIAFSQPAKAAFCEWIEGVAQLVEQRTFNP